MELAILVDVVRLILSPPVRAALISLARSEKEEHRLVTRSKIILSVASGKSVGEAAAGYGVTCKTVRKWCHRFAQNPVVSTLSDAPRSDRPIQIPSDIRCQIIKLACSNPLKRDPLRNVWTIGSLKQQLQQETGWNVSSSEIHRILSSKEIRSHRVKMWLHSPDPDFSVKVKRICTLYISPPPKATVLCIDEKTGIQALERKYPFKHAGVGREGRKEFEYVRHGTRSLFAALDIKTGAITGHCSPCRGANDLLTFMEHLAKVYPKGPIYIIWNNLNIHHGDRWKKIQPATPASIPIRLHPITCFLDKSGRDLVQHSAAQGLKAWILQNRR